MPTNPIGFGTANLNINMPLSEKQLWGRLAFQAISRGEARSVGDYSRQLLAKGLEVTDPESALRLREIRNRYYAGSLAALFVASFLVSWLGGSDGDSVRRSASMRTIRRVAEGREGRLEFEMEGWA
jgi:hypothetical protein